jgi:RNA polymerase sigma factor (sigma-70 family)
MDKSGSIHIKFLWKSFLEGDNRAFSIIYQRYAESLLSYGYKFNIDKEIVHDALQEVFIDLYLKRGKLHIGINNLKGYLFTALKNNLLKKIAKGKRIEFYAIDKVQSELHFSTEYSFQDQLIQMEISGETKKKLRAAIDSLSSRQKEIIFLRFEEGMEYSEIAKTLNITIESARKQLYRALMSLRKLVDPGSFHIFFISFSKKYLKTVHIF